MSDNLPERGEIWLHHSGTRYQIVDVANLITATPAAKPDSVKKFPVTIIYRVEHSPITDPFALFARTWLEFKGSFERVKET